MNENGWSILNDFRGKINPESCGDLLNRVMLIRDYFKDKTYNEDSLYQYMEKSTKDKFSKCEYNSNIFFDFYNATKGFHDKRIIELLYLIRVRQERIPYDIANLFKQQIEHKLYKKVLITECEKWSSILIDIIKGNKDINFTLTVNTNDISFKNLYHLIYDKYKNVKLIDINIYEKYVLDEKYDGIISIPDFSRKISDNEKIFMTRDSNIIAVQNMLLELDKEADLIVVLPARIAFGAGMAKKLRAFIIENFSVRELSKMPSKIFYPYVNNIETFFAVFTNKSEEIVDIKSYSFKPAILNEHKIENLSVENKLSITKNEFNLLDTWNIDSIFLSKDEVLEKYNTSIVKKVMLKDVATVFRGKAFFKKDEVENGNIGVINIIDINENDIDYSNLSFIKNEVRKIASYKLEDKDILVTSRGTQIKIGLFKQQEFPCIPSANINVIRLETEEICSEYLKLFLESPTGQMLLKKLQRGSMLVNLNFNDLKEIELPLIPKEDQIVKVNSYKLGLFHYNEAVQKWESIKRKIYQEIY